MKWMKLIANNYGRKFQFLPYNQNYIPSTLNTDYLLWHTQLIVRAVKY